MDDAILSSRGKSNDVPLQKVEVAPIFFNNWEITATHVKHF